MVWVEIAINKFGVKIASFFWLHSVSGGVAAIKIFHSVLSFDKRSTNHQKLALF